MQVPSVSRGSRTPGWLPSLDTKMVLHNKHCCGSTFVLIGLSPQLVPKFKSTVSHRIFSAVGAGDPFLPPGVVSAQADLQVRAREPTQQEVESGASCMTAVCCISEQPLTQTRSGVGGWACIVDLRDFLC